MTNGDKNTTTTDIGGQPRVDVVCRSDQPWSDHIFLQTRSGVAYKVAKSMARYININII